LGHPARSGGLYNSKLLQFYYGCLYLELEGSSQGG
jgi:hypothetical protein